MAARDWKIAGSAAPKVDGRDFVTGRHQYTSDLDPPRNAARQGAASRGVQGQARFGRHACGREAGSPGRAGRGLRRRRRARCLDGGARPLRDQGRMGRASATLEQGAVRIPQEERGEERARRAAGQGLRRAGHGVGGRQARADLHGRVHRARSARAAGGGGGVERRQADRLDRDAAPLRRARRAGRGFSHPRGARAGPGARHGLRLRRQAHRRRGRRGGAPGEGGRQAGQGRLDPRGGVHLGVSATRRRDRGRERRAGATARSWPGSSTTTTPAPPRSRRPTRSPTRRSSSIPSPRRCARAPTGASRPRRTTSRARRTWTSWRAPWPWTRSSCA